MDVRYDAIVVGAGVVGPGFAIALARQGRKVMLVERNWQKQDRIVGELLQPAGVKALRELGVVQAINNIEAIPHYGYYIDFKGKKVTIGYPFKDTGNRTNPLHPVPDAVFNGNGCLVSDSTIDASAWEKDERMWGFAFHNGEFLQNLRSMAQAEENIDTVEGTATKLLRDEKDENQVVGVKVKEKGSERDYRTKLVFCCDGIYSNFRKTLSPDRAPEVESYFVGFSLFNAKLPAPNHGHVILGDHAPVLLYQNSPREVRLLCAYRSSKAPSQKNNDLFDYLTKQVLPALPPTVQASFEKALETKKYKAMPNQYFSAPRQGDSLRGVVFLGDSLNLRHPLTGGGMTVGLCDSVLLAKLLQPAHVQDLLNYKLIAKKLAIFQSRRKNLDAVINTLSIALYTLFAADTTSLKALQNGCIEYFLLGGNRIEDPIGLLSGMLPFPMLLFNHFFSVAFYSIALNFKKKGILGFPAALWDAICILYVAAVVFLPYLWKELI